MTDHVPAPRRSRLALSLGLAFQFAALLIVWEIALRVVWERPGDDSPRAFAPDPAYGFAPVPGASGVHVSGEYSAGFDHGQYGFRSDDLAVDAPGARERVLVLGDSQTYGLGVPEGEGFCDRLIESFDSRIALVNAGCNGYGTRNSLAVLHHFGEVWRPDRVWLVFFWNDLEDDWSRSEPQFARDAQGQLISSAALPAAWTPLSRAGLPETEPRPERFQSRLALFLKERTRPWRYRWLGSKARDIASVEDRDMAWKTQRDLLKAVRDRTAELGAELTVIALPNQTQIDPSAAIPSIRPLNYDVQERLFEVCRELGVRTFDLRPALRAAFEETDQPLYYFADRHLTPRGHAVVASALQAALLEPTAPNPATSAAQAQ